MPGIGILLDSAGPVRMLAPSLITIFLAAGRVDFLALGSAGVEFIPQILPHLVILFADHPRQCGPFALSYCSLSSARLCILFSDCRAQRPETT
jgi:hypothetical protein